MTRPALLRSVRHLGLCALLLATAAAIQAAEPLIRSGQTLAFLGDSITQFGAASSGGYVRLVESGLAAIGCTVKVIPAGISGHKSNQMRERLDKDVLSKKPDWMTLSCGVNDVWHGANGVPLDAYKVNITDIVDRCEKAGVKVMILTATEIGLPVDNPNNTKLKAYNEFLRQLAAERKLPIADLFADMVAQQDADKAAKVKRSLTVDGVHMNPYGNLMMARGVLRAFGLDDAQMAKVEAAWQALPDAVPETIKVGISLPELAILEKLAEAKKMSVGDWLNQEVGAAAKAAIAAHAQEVEGK